MSLVTYFEPSVPWERAAFSVGEGAPHPMAVRAAEELWRRIEGEPPREGKMFGVLVVADREGRVGYTCAFSGMLDGRWERAGYVPPVFDVGARDAFWVEGEAELGAMTAEIEAARGDREAEGRRRALEEVWRRQAEEREALQEVHRRRRDERRVAREALGAGAAARERHALDQESRGDAAERRRMEADHEAEVEALVARVDAHERAITALVHDRAERSRELQRRVHEGYVFANARGERRDVVALFAPAVPPSGAGDCAGPKLLAHAFANGLTPIALAERWWGAPPASGGRVAGTYYPPCRGKCGPILAHMLDGLVREAGPAFGGGPVAADEPRVVFEDDWLVVVDKPCELLSVPGRTPDLEDSVLTRLRKRYPGATGPLLVHRLDLQTSGLLVAAKDAATHAGLQQQFVARLVEKRYVAWLDGEPGGDSGVIDLPLRVDVDDRPRQIVDPVHGRPAYTQWRVIERRAGRTRVVLVPRTGRTHQLRVHAAHPEGLGAPIVGDPLYGRPDRRLMLHAEEIGFVHPQSGQHVIVRSPAPF